MGDEQQIPAEPAQRATWGRWLLAGYGSLGLLMMAALLLASWFFLPSQASLAGLEGTWRQDSDPKHSYQFRASGDVDAWYESLPMGRFMRWQRDGPRITIRTDRNWDFVGELKDGEIRGQQFLRDQTGAVTSTVDGVWRRQ